MEKILCIHGFYDRICDRIYLVKMVGNGNEAVGFRVVMGIFGVAGCVCFLLTFALVRENNLSQTEKSATLKETIQSAAHNTPWKLFALNILFMWTGYFIQSSALVYYYKYYVGSTKMGKYRFNVFCISLLLLIPFYMIFRVLQTRGPWYHHRPLCLKLYKMD